MRCCLLICVLLAVMLAEASCFSEEDWYKFELFADLWRAKIEKLRHLIFGVPEPMGTPMSTPIVRGCIVPEPPNGARIVGGYPGQMVPPAFQLTYSCTDGYIISGSEISICTNGVWHMTPTCSRPQNPEPSQYEDYRFY